MAARRVALPHGAVSWPWETAISVVTNFRTIAYEIGITLGRAFTAFGLSVLIMVPPSVSPVVACALGLIVDPILEFPVTIPRPAVIPIVMVIAAMGARRPKIPPSAMR